MSEEEKANWLKIKAHLEEQNCTDNFFYKRACAIADDKPDPMEPLK